MQNVRERVRLAREIEGLDLQMRRENDNRNWKKKAADDIGILDDSEDSLVQGLYLNLNFIQLSCSDWEANNNRAQKQVCLAIKQKKQQLGKLLSTKIIGNNIRSLKFPIGPENLKKIEANSVEAVKQSVANKNGKGIKLFRKTKKHLTVDKRNKKGK